MKKFNLQAAQAFLGRLSNREKMVLYGAACVVSLMFLDRFIISAISSRFQAVYEQIEEKKAGIKRSLRIIAQKDKILSVSAQYASLLHNAGSKEETVTSILKEIESLANTSSVYLVDIKPAGSKNVGAAREYLVSLNCEAQMEQLVEFMYNIENSNKFLLIEKYQISPKSKESSVARCSMTISKISML